MLYDTGLNSIFAICTVHIDIYKPLCIFFKELYEALRLASVLRQHLSSVRGGRGLYSDHRL